MNIGGQFCWSRALFDGRERRLIHGRSPLHSDFVINALRQCRKNKYVECLGYRSPPGSYRIGFRRDRENAEWTEHR